MWSESRPGCCVWRRLQHGWRSRRSWLRRGWPPPGTFRYSSCSGSACCQTSWIPAEGKRVDGGGEREEGERVGEGERGQSTALIEMIDGPGAPL